MTYEYMMKAAESRQAKLAAQAEADRIEVEAEVVREARKVPALGWATAIFGQYAKVSTPDQKDFARYILNDDWASRIRVEPIGPSFAELDAKLAALNAPKVAPAVVAEPEAIPAVAPIITITVPAVAGKHEVTVDGVVMVVTVKAKVARKPRTRKVAVAVAACCDPAEVEPCSACLPDHAAVEPDAKPVPAPTAEPDPLADLPFPRPEPGRYVSPGPWKPTRLMPRSGRYDLAGLVAATADAYAEHGSPVAGLIARTLVSLAAEIAASGAKSVAEFESYAPIP